jgi:hypothetical protein
MVAINPLCTTSPSRVRYAAGVSLSSRSGYEIASRDDPDLDANVGVLGVPLEQPFRKVEASEFCLNLRLKMSPKLLRPLVEVGV